MTIERTAIGAVLDELTNTIVSRTKLSTLTAKQLLHTHLEQLCKTAYVTVSSVCVGVS